jgi:hypothetical protein
MKKICLLFALALSLNGFTQTLNFQNGQKLEVITQVQKTSALELMGQSMESKVNATLTEIFDVKNVANNAATIEHKVKRLVFNAEGMQGAQSFDSEKEGDMKGEMGKMLEKGIKNKYTLTMDAIGSIVAVKLDDDNPKGNEEADAMLGMMSMQTGINLATPKAGDPSEFKVLPGRDVKQGESWTDTSSSAIGKTKTVYTVKNLTDTEVILDFTEEQKIEGTQNIMGQEAAMNGTTKSTGTATVDRKTGILKSKISTIDSDITISAQGMSFPVKDKSTRTVTVKPA